MIALALVILIILFAAGLLVAKSGRRQLGVALGLWALFFILVLVLTAPQPEPEPLRPIDDKLRISQPATFQQVEQQATARSFTSFFSLRAPERYQLRVDLSPRQTGLQIGFLGPEAAAGFSVATPVFDVLIANQLRSKKVFRQLATSTDKVIDREGFQIFMPPPEAQRKDVFFVASRTVIATIVSPGQPVRETADDLQLVRP